MKIIKSENILSYYFERTAMDTKQKLEEQGYKVELYYDEDSLTPGGKYKVKIIE